ncbi:hypothetical protein QZH41_006955 [Actinostola sp. cb2023]|nr:hypothetical protein QZH41_006955 [Actinostola sp. cb2023]
MVVLGYIANNSRRFHIFVANRVQQIQDLTSIDQWRYVNTESNPADDASRGLTAHQLLSSRWLKGPDFLWKESQWPAATITGKNEVEPFLNDPEVKKAVVMATASSSSEEEEDALLVRLEYFSDWHRAKRAIALCIRYVQKLKEIVKKKRSLESMRVDEVKVSKRNNESSYLPITVQEMERAEGLIIQAVQRNSFKDEFASLKMVRRKTCPDERENATQRERHAKTSSPLYKLDPYVDSGGILRVGGRLRRATLSDTSKFPAILPRKAHISTLIIKHYHERMQHQGRSLTLNEVRFNGFWVVGGSSAVGIYISNCVTCRRL